MPKKMNMNISVNGQSRVPPGFRFHPTEEELLQYYLRKKVANDEIDLDVIFEVDLNKLEPWDIQEKCSIGTTPQNDWYFFSHKDKKYPTGTRTNRATTAGFWKATGRDKVIYSNCKRIGMRKTLVFYKGRAPHGQKSDWIMHEYRLDDFTNSDSDLITNAMNGDQVGQEEGWVVCRIFKKKNHVKTRVDSPILNTTFEPHHHSCLIDSSSDRDHDHDHHDDQGALDQIFQIIRTTTPNPNPVPNPNMKLPSLDSPNHITTHQPIPIQFENDIVSMMRSCGPDPNSESGLGDWAALDRFVATHLNGQTTSCDHLQLPPLMTSSSTSLLLSTNKIHNPAASATLDNYGGNENINIDHLWSFARSSSSSSLAVDPLCHVSDPGL